MTAQVMRFNLLALCVLSPVLYFLAVPLSARLLVLVLADAVNIAGFIVSVRHKAPSMECALVAIVLSGLLALFLANRMLGII